MGIPISTTRTTVSRRQARMLSPSPGTCHTIGVQQRLTAIITNLLPTYMAASRLTPACEKIILTGSVTLGEAT
jgi:hypothetical protein